MCVELPENARGNLFKEQCGSCSWSHGKCLICKECARFSKKYCDCVDDATHEEIEANQCKYYEDWYKEYKEKWKLNYPRNFGKSESFLEKNI